MSIQIIHDQSKAIQEKIEKDALNRRVMLPAHILGFLALATSALAIITACQVSAGNLEPIYLETAGVLAAFTCILWFVAWNLRSDHKQAYSANLQYYLITKDKTVTKIWVTGPTKGRYSCGTLLHVKVRDGEGRATEKEIGLWGADYRKDITCDTIDFLNTYDNECDDDWGRYYRPYTSGQERGGDASPNECPACGYGCNTRYCGNCGPLVQPEE